GRGLTGNGIPDSGTERLTFHVVSAMLGLGVTVSPHRRFSQFLWAKTPSTWVKKVRWRTLSGSCVACRKNYNVKSRYFFVSGCTAARNLVESTKIPFVS